MSALDRLMLGGSCARRTVLHANPFAKVSTTVNASSLLIVRHGHSAVQSRQHRHIVATAICTFLHDNQRSVGGVTTHKYLDPTLPFLASGSRIDPEKI